MKISRQCIHQIAAYLSLFKVHRMWSEQHRYSKMALEYHCKMALEYQVCHILTPPVVSSFDLQFLPEEFLNGLSVILVYLLLPLILEERIEMHKYII